MKILRVWVHSSKRDLDDGRTDNDNKCEAHTFSIPKNVENHKRMHGEGNYTFFRKASY